MNRATAANIAKQARRRQAAAKRGAKERAAQMACDHAPPVLDVENNFWHCPKCQVGLLPPKEQA